MSGSAQPGIHPDAETLSAFAEQALAAGERERIVAHLALCGRCREVVYLAHESNVELEPMMVAAASPASAQVAARTPWFRNWRLAWIPAAALAAGVSVAYIVHLQHQEPARQIAGVDRHVAEVQAIPPAPAPRLEVAETRKEGQPKVPREGESAGALKSSASANLPEKKHGGAGETGGAALGGKETSEGAVEQKEKPVLQAQVGLDEPAAKGAKPLSAGTQKAAEDAMATAGGAVQAPAQAPAAQPEIARAQAARPTAGKTGIAGRSFAALARLQTALPSGLATVSTVAAHGSVLSVDKAGSVYLSADGGKQWESIERQWSGQAVQLRSVIDSIQKPSDGKASLRESFELVNDKGQVWVSVDGRSWQSR